MEKEELNEEYVAILRDIHESANEGKEFIVGQAPLVAKELVYVRGIEHGGFAIGFIAATIAVLVGGTMLYRSAKKIDDPIDGPFLRFGAVALTVVCGALFSVGVICNCAHIAKCVYAPRVVVLEEVGKLLK